MFHTCVPKITIMWCMFPEIRSATDKSLCHYGPFFALLPPYGLRKLKFWKIRKTLQDIIILQIFTINDSHMIYGFSDMSATSKFFCHFGLFFPFYNPKNQSFETLKKEPLTRKIKVLKHWRKNPWRYHHFTQVSQKSRSYAILFLRCGT